MGSTFYEPYFGTTCSEVWFRSRQGHWPRSLWRSWAGSEKRDGNILRDEDPIQMGHDCTFEYGLFSRRTRCSCSRGQKMDYKSSFCIPRQFTTLPCHGLLSRKLFQSVENRFWMPFSEIFQFETILRWRFINVNFKVQWTASWRYRKILYSRNGFGNWISS